MNIYKSSAEVFFEYHKNLEPKVTEVFVGELWAVDETGHLSVDPDRYTATVSVITAEGKTSVESIGASATEALIGVAVQIGSDWRG